MVEIKDLSGKKILVIGLGLHGGGVGAVKFLSKRARQIIVTDLRTAKELAPSLKRIRGLKNLQLVLGEHRLTDLTGVDLVLKGPGVKPDSVFLKAARSRGIPVVNDLAIFWGLCPAKIIGITGTRGKSTAAFLIWQLLKTKFKKVHLAGNIRKSVLGILPQIKKDDWVILELSSFQLQDLADSRVEIGGKPAFAKAMAGKPEIAVLTNFLPDHLNWHKNFADYIRAKSFVFAFQNSSNYIFANPEDAELKKLVQKAKAQKVFPRLPQEFSGLVAEKLGEHYCATVGLAWAVASHLGVGKNEFVGILRKWKGLEGRQEIIGEIKGIKFVNDTTSTMPEATIAAIQRFEKLAGKNKLILIAGGQDKNLKFKNLAAAIKKGVDFLVLLPGTGTDKLRQELRIPAPEQVRYGAGKNTRLACLPAGRAGRQEELRIREARSMPEAVKISFSQVRKGDWIVLSPGAASFGLFLNEFDRGKAFQKEFLKIKRQE